MFNAAGDVLHFTSALARGMYAQVEEVLGVHVVLRWVHVVPHWGFSGCRPFEPAFVAALIVSNTAWSV